MDKNTYLLRKYQNNLNFQIPTEIIDTSEQTKRLINFINENITTNNSIFIINQLELGDNIIINGLIRHYSSIYNNVILVCRNDYFDQLKIMYQDLSNLYLYQIHNETKNVIHLYDFINVYVPYNDEIIFLFKEKKILFQPMAFHTNKYKLSNKFVIKSNVYYPKLLFTRDIDYSIRYSKFKINRDLDKENKLYDNLVEIIGESYCIIIDDKSRNFIINNNNNDIPIFRLSPNANNNNLDLILDDNIFNYIKILENAKEIHTIDSSIVLLIDQLDINVKTYIHRYIRKNFVEYRNKNFIVYNNINEYITPPKIQNNKINLKSNLKYLKKVI
jgi:hypothetical protein